MIYSRLGINKSLHRTIISNYSNALQLQLQLFLIKSPHQRHEQQLHHCQPSSSAPATKKKEKLNVSQTTKQNEQKKIAKRKEIKNGSDKQDSGYI